MPNRISKHQVPAQLTSGGTWVKARGLKDRNPFIQRVFQQATYVRRHPETSLLHNLMRRNNKYFYFNTTIAIVIVVLVRWCSCSHTTEPSQRCILTDYFNNYNFSKGKIIRSLMMVIEPKHVEAVLM